MPLRPGVACLLVVSCSVATSGSGTVREGSARAIAIQAEAPVVKRLAEPGWVEVTAEVVASEDEAPSEARRRALTLARCAAVSDVAGTSVTSGTVSFESLRGDDNTDLIQALGVTRSEAVIVDERLQAELVLPLLSGRGYRMQVTLRARVVDRSREGDPGFRVTVDLGRERFLDGEDVALAVTSTREARIFVMNVTDDGAIVLLPNAYQRDTRVSAGGTLRFPDEALKARGVSLKARVPTGRRKVVETLLVVAVKGGAELPRISPTQGIFRIEESSAAVRLLGDLLAPLAALPPSDWTIEQVPYEVWSR